MGNTTFQGPVKTGPVISGATSGGYRGKDLADTNWVSNSLVRYFQEPTAADTDGICASQTTSAAANMTLNGALCATINGNSVYAPSVSSTAANFKSVTKIATSGATTGNITVGTAAVAADVYCRALGVIPYQSTVTGIKIWVAEAFNAGTADPMEIGKSDDQDYLADLADGTMGAVTTTGNTGGSVTVDATQSAVWKSVEQADTGADGVAYNSDVQAVLTYTPTGALSTAGQAWIKIDFMQGKNLASGDTW